MLVRIRADWGAGQSGRSGFTQSALKSRASELDMSAFIQMHLPQAGGVAMGEDM